MNQLTHRFSHVHSDVLFPLKIKPPIGVPSVYIQADMLGGEFTRILHGLPENSVANFSPSIIKHNDKRLIAWRSQPEPFGFRYDMKYFYLNNKPTEIYIGELTDDATIIGSKKLRTNPHKLSYEDPRLFSGSNNDLYVQFVASTYASKYDSNKNNLFFQPKVVVCHINENAEAVSAVIPPIGQNRIADKTEKNWCFYCEEGELRCLYSTRPLIIERENGPKIEIDSSVLDTVTKNCPTFNSTAPLDLGDSYLIFYHWKHMAYEPSGNTYLLYYLSAYLLNKTTQKISYIIKEPLFTGSLEDGLIKWTDAVGSAVSKQPALVLPFGAVLEGDMLSLSAGVNDSFMGILKTSINNILKLCKPVTI